MPKQFIASSKLPLRFYLIAIGVFPTGEIEAVGTLKDFVDIQLIGA